MPEDHGTILHRSLVLDSTSHLYATFQECTATVDALEKGLALQQARQQTLLIRILEEAQQDAELQTHLRQFHKGLHTTYLDVRASGNDVLVFKGAPAESDEAQQIQRDYYITQHLMYPAFSSIDHEQQCVQPLAFFEHRGNVYYVTRKKNTKNLEERLHEAKLTPKMLEGALDTFALLHTKIITEVNVEEDTASFDTPTDTIMLRTYHYQREFMDRVIVGRPTDKHPRLAQSHEIVTRRGVRTLIKGVNPWLDAVIDAYDQLVQTMTQIAHDNPLTHTIVHGDALLRNVLEDGTVMDFERCAVGNPLLDVATLLGNAGYTGDVERGIIDYYLQRLYVYNHTYGNKEVHKLKDNRFDRELRFLYLCNRIHFALCHMGTMLRDGSEEHAGEMLEEAWQILTKGTDRPAQLRIFEPVKNALQSYIDSALNPYTEFRRIVNS